MGWSTCRLCIEQNFLFATMPVGIFLLYYLASSYICSYRTWNHCYCKDIYILPWINKATLLPRMFKSVHLELRPWTKSPPLLAVIPHHYHHHYRKNVTCWLIRGLHEGLQIQTNLLFKLYKKKIQQQREECSNPSSTPASTPNEVQTSCTSIPPAASHAPPQLPPP